MKYIATITGEDFDLVAGSMDEAIDAAVRLAQSGDWGDGAVTISIWVTAVDQGHDEIESQWVDVEVGE